jgi:cytochrome b subunit of formate dehydrogenase
MSRISLRPRGTSGQEYLRFNLAQRLEHWVMVISFTALALTGLPQKFAGDGWAETMIAWMGGIETVRVLHHAAAIILVLVGIYHGVSLMYKAIVERARWTMYPQLQDVFDAIHAVLYNLGMRKEAPRYDHFSFDEKFEYWALVWGTLIMALTGFMLWNPIIASHFVSGDVIPAAKAAHGAEAILAVLAVLVWHVYNVHLKTFNRAMFTGELSAHEMQEEHGLELERLARGDNGGTTDPVKLRQRQRVFLPIAGVVSLALLLGVFLFTTAETTAVTTIQRQPGQLVQVYVPQTKTPTPALQPTATATRQPQVVEATPGGGTPGATAAAQTTAAPPPTAASGGAGAAKALPADHAGRSVCLVCHTSGVAGAPKVPPDHGGRLDAQCADCHKPQ